MDPNANLKEQLQLARDIIDGPVEHPEDATRLAVLVLALHEWLAAGGFPPLWGKG